MWKYVKKRKHAKRNLKTISPILRDKDKEYKEKKDFNVGNQILELEFLTSSAQKINHLKYCSQDLLICMLLDRYRGPYFNINNN